MKLEQNYPSKKVVVGFALCPAIVGLLAGPMGLYFGENPDGFHGLDLVMASIAASLLASVTSTLFYFPPAFLLALIYARLRLKKDLLSYVIVTSGGSAGAILWGALLSPEREAKGYFQALIGAWLTQPFFVSVLLGAGSSLLVAYLVLPQENPKNEPPRE